MNNKSQQGGEGRGTVSRARVRNVDTGNPRTSKRTYDELLGKLLRRQAYVRPTLLILSAHAQAADSCDSGIPRPLPPIPTPFECPSPLEVSALDDIGEGLLVGGLAAAGGIKIYRNAQEERADQGLPRNSS